MSEVPSDRQPPETDPRIPKDPEVSMLPDAERAARRQATDRSFVRSLTWTGGVKWAAQLLSWIGTLVVARLLSPEDYGLVGMAAVYLGLVTLLSELGLGLTVVTLRELTPMQVRQLNSVAVAMGVASFLLSIAAAGPISVFFEEPRLERVVVVLSVGFIITSFRIIPAGLLQRDLHFKSLALIEGLQAIVLTIVLIVLAWWGWGYWTLVAGNILAPLIATTAVVSIQRVGFARPRITELKESLTFTRHQLTGNLSWYVYSNADFLVAGKVLGAGPLGIYSLAWTLAQSVPEKVVGLITRVTPAYFSAVQDDLVELRRYLLRLTEILALISFPALVGLALVAGPLVNVVLEERWLGMVAPLQILSAYAAYNSVTQLLSRVLTVRRETRFLMRIGLFLAATMPFAFWAGSRWGPTGIALAWLTLHPLARIPVLLRVRRVTELPLRTYFAAFIPAGVSTLVMAAAVLLASWALVDASGPIQLVSMVSVGVVSYVAVVLTLFRRRVRPILKLLRQSARRPGAEA